MTRNHSLEPTRTRMALGPPPRVVHHPSGGLFVSRCRWVSALDLWFSQAPGYGDFLAEVGCSKTISLCWRLALDPLRLRLHLRSFGSWPVLRTLLVHAYRQLPNPRLFRTVQLIPQVLRDTLH